MSVECTFIQICNVIRVLGLPATIKRVNVCTLWLKNGPRRKMLLVYVGAGDSSNQPKIEIQSARLTLRRNEKVNVTTA